MTPTPSDILNLLIPERDAARDDYNTAPPGSLAEASAHGRLLGLTVAVNIAEKIIATADATREDIKP